MHKNATKCNKTVRKWCKNKHGAPKIIDTFETYQWRCTSNIFGAIVWSVMKLASITIWSLAFSYRFDKPWFHNWEKTCCCAHHTFLLGFPTSCTYKPSHINTIRAVVQPTWGNPKDLVIRPLGTNWEPLMFHLPLGTNSPWDFLVPTHLMSHYKCQWTSHEVCFNLLKENGQDILIWGDVWEIAHILLLLWMTGLLLYTLPDTSRKGLR
jgi:hypothetical protein